MFNTHPELLDRPALPQYGRELAICQAELAFPPAIWMRVAFTFTSFIGLSWMALMLGNVLPPQAGTPLILCSTSICGTILIWFGTQALRGPLRPTPVFVFEKGIHLSESVLYTVPGGHRLSICRGVRQVSLPWRVLRKIVSTGDSRDESSAPLYVRLPDGRKLRFTSGGSPEHAAAVKQLRRSVDDEK